MGPFVFGPYHWALLLMLTHSWGLVNGDQADCIARMLLDFNLLMLDNRVISCGEGVTTGLRVHDLGLDN